MAIHNPERLKEMRTKMLEHLEAALALADQKQDGTAGYMIECALDSIRSAHWPDLDPNLERFRKGNANEHTHAQIDPVSLACTDSRLGRCLLKRVTAMERGQTATAQIASGR